MPVSVIERFTLNDVVLQPDILSDPYALYRRLRLEDPVHWDPVRRQWMVSRYRDVATLLDDRRLSAERHLGPVSPVDADPVKGALAKQMLHVDPPDHTRLRGAFTVGFTPRRMQNSRILEIVTGLLNAAQDCGQMDFIRDFAVPLPVVVIAELLGVPAEDQAQLRSWSRSFSRLLDGLPLTLSETSEAHNAVLAFMDYLRSLIALRRRNPADDMISDLAAIKSDQNRRAPMNCSATWFCC